MIQLDQHSLKWLTTPGTALHAGSTPGKYSDEKKVNR